MRKLELRLWIAITFLLIFIPSHTSYASIVEMQQISYYPKNIGDRYFRPIVDLAIVDDKIYSIENMKHRAIAFQLEFPQINYAFDIGKFGQGPGDLQWPISLSIWNDEICIKESGFFSFFKTNGKFLSKFRIFSAHSTFIYIDNKIYWLNPDFKKDYLFEIYTKEGERLQTFGNKFLKTGIFTFQNASFIQTLLYEGNVFYYGKSIYYFNSRFGNYFIYSLDGKTLAEGDISIHFGERGEKIKKYNNERYIKQNKKIRKKGSGYPKSVIFEDAYLCKDKIYFTCSTQSKKNGGVETAFDFFIINIKSMNLIEKSIIRKESLCRLDSLAVVEENGEDYILLALTDHSNGFFLELYTK
jgi:hypothetical protein